MRLIDSCITQRKALGPSRTCNESKEEEGTRFGKAGVGSEHLAAALVAIAAAPLEVVVADLLPRSGDQGLFWTAKRGTPRKRRKGPVNAPGPLTRRMRPYRGTSLIRTEASPLVRQHLPIDRKPSSGSTRRLCAELRMS